MLSRATLVIGVGALSVLLVGLSPLVSQVDAVTIEDALAKVDSVSQAIQSLTQSDVNKGTVEKILSKSDKLLEKIDDKVQDGKGKSALKNLLKLQSMLEKKLTVAGLAKVQPSIDDAAAVIKQL